MSKDKPQLTKVIDVGHSLSHNFLKDAWYVMVDLIITNFHWVSAVFFILLLYPIPMWLKVRPHPGHHFVYSDMKTPLL